VESKELNNPFVLMLGTNFRHKNRVYVLKVFRLLIEEHNWNGDLVFAGPNVLDGSSEKEEALLLSNYSQLKARVHYLGRVSEEEKKWLLENAALVVYPSNYEGFGLVPFEASVMGTPALATNLTSLSEVLGDQVLYLESLDPGEGVKKFLSLLSDSHLAQLQVTAIRERAAYYTWSKVAKRTWNFYERILEMPPRRSYDDCTVERSLSIEQKIKYSAAAQEVSSWRRRMAGGCYLFFTQGFGALFREIRNYVRWLWIRIQANRSG
jgi:glycosyltransferase involved in cell wall biosynthesis